MNRSTHERDAEIERINDETFAVVFAGIISSSILSVEFRQRLARGDRRLIRSEGFMFRYDLCVDHECNPDIRRVPRREIRDLCPDARCTFHRTPMTRRALRLGGWAYPLLAAVSTLRHHFAVLLETRMRRAQA